MVELYKDDEQCCGCSACEAVCPTNNIYMKLNQEGFYYPAMYSEEKCIDCKQCLKVCPMKHSEAISNPIHKVYAAVTKDEDVWESSASGGAFSEVCRVLSKENPIIFGARWDGLSVIMDECEGFQKMNPFRKSKYVCAYPNGTYRRVKMYLENDRYVIYSGTPCQINGLKLFLRKDYKKLLTIDFACHGQGSKTIFDKWIEHLEKQYNQKIVSFQFREKKLIVDHVNSNCCSFTLESGEKVYETRDYYHHTYVNGLHMRKCCDECQFAASRKSDITLADFKNLKKGWPDLSKQRNVSTIISNSPKGEKIASLLTNMTIIEPDINFVYTYNPKLIKAVPGNSQRDNFMQQILENHEDILETILIYSKMTLAERFEYNHSEKASEIFVPILNAVEKIMRIPNKINVMIQKFHAPGESNNGK